MELILSPRSISDYRQFVAVKKLPSYRIRGRRATFPDSYATHLGIAQTVAASGDYQPEPFLFDYQRDITATAIAKRKYAVFADCGLGKSLILLSYARHVSQRVKGRVLILTPPMVVKQLCGEAARFWGDDLPVERPVAANLQEWLDSPGNAIGVTNYEALKKTLRPGNLKALILDESSNMKSHYGNYAGICLRLGRGLDWKLSLTGTPAPNDRIEFANQAVFLDRFPTVNAFLATFFINRGQTGNRWELKPHSVRPFYRSLSDWSIFLTSPASYGWSDNAAPLPPIDVTIHEVPLTQQQRAWVNKHLRAVVATRAGGITMRSACGQVSKGFWKGTRYDTNKPGVISDLIAGWSPRESTLVWCRYDAEQELLDDLPQNGSIYGKTPMARRETIIDQFKRREIAIVTSKPKILGFGLNLQVATRHVFSGIEDSYEQYYQCVKRSNRYGATDPLRVHIPVTELEEPMMENVLQKAKRVEQDTREQEALFIQERLS